MTEQKPLSEEEKSEIIADIQREQLGCNDSDIDIIADLEAEREMEENSIQNYYDEEYQKHLENQKERELTKQYYKDIETDGGYC